MEDNDVAALLDDWLASAPVSADASAEQAPPAPRAPTETLLQALAADANAIAPLVGEAAASPAPEGHRDRYLVFTIAATVYAVLETSVTEVGRIPKITPVPRVPAWLRGVTSLRGEVLSVVDLRVFLGLEPTSPHTGRLLVVRLADDELSLGLLVDGVDQIAAVNASDVRPPASTLEGALAPHLAGVTHVGDRLVAVLDLETLLNSADVRQFEDRKPE